VPAQRVARLVVERADRAVGQPVGQEVQVVEHDQRPERHGQVDRPAHGHPDHAVGPLLLQRPDVGPVLHLVGQPLVAGLVAGDVQHLRASHPALGDERVAVARLHVARVAGLEAGQLVRAGAGEDADPHTAHR
jgi:hypothetical protein